MMMALSSSAQVDTGVTYFNKNWKEVSDKSNATYYRKVWKDNDKTQVVNHYMSNTKPQMKGSYIIENGDSIKDGHFIYYHENGWKASEGYFSENIAIGNWKHYFENGKLSADLNYMTDIARINSIKKNQKLDHFT